jgi:uncharacterized protein (DUF3820 family)
MRAWISAIAILILVTICASAEVNEGRGQGGQASCSSGCCESAYYTCMEPCGSELLAESRPGLTIQPVDPSLSQNKLWIACLTGPLRLSELSLPMGSWAAMELIPYEEGYVTIFQRSPSGELSTGFKGYVYPRHKYRLWFDADLPGTYQLWYRAGYHDSNKVSFRVYC